jgi:hypothetical protein
MRRSSRFTPLLRSFSAEALSVKHLSSTIECLRSFQAAQRFRKGVNAGNYTTCNIAVCFLFCFCALSFERTAFHQVDFALEHLL